MSDLLSSEVFCREVGGGMLEVVKCYAGEWIGCVAHQTKLFYRGKFG